MSKSEEPFTTRMRKATRKSHSLSDALVNAKFALSLSDESVWAGGLFVFYHIFAFLEDAKKRLNIQDFNDLFVNDALYRKQAFEEDLTKYYGNIDWRSLSKSPALDNYLEHLQNLERENPRLLMAYVYHLYLGLLSGGQILMKKRNFFPGATKSVDTQADKVTDFSTVNIAEIKNDFRTVMNNIAEKMSEAEKQAFIEESNQVFILNNSIVNSVSGQNEVISNIIGKISVVIIAVLGAALIYKFSQ